MINNMERKKIIVTASTFPRWQGDCVPMFVHDQLIFLKKNYPNFEIIVLAPHHQDAKSYEKAPFGKIFRFKYFFPVKFQKLVYPAIMPNLKKNKWLYLQIPFLIFFEFIALWRLVLNEKPDFIYSHWFIPQGIVGGLVELLTGTKHVYTSHSSDVMIARKLPVLGAALVRFFTKRTRKITVVSQRTLNKLKSFFTLKEWDEVYKKVKVIPMGVDIPSFSKPEKSSKCIKEKYGYQNRKILFFIGRLAEKKGLKYLLEALVEYVKRDASILLVIAGDGPLLEELQQKVKSIGIEGYVDFIGYTTGDKKLELFVICDIIILPSIITDDGDAEGFPVVLMEGLAAGKICVATDASGADDVLEDSNDGFIIQPNDSKHILSVLLKINRLSEKKKQVISINAIETSKKFDWNNIAKNHVEHLFE